MCNRLLRAKQRRRNQISIVANVLEIAREGVLKTQIMYRANLSYTQLNDYLSFLLDSSLIRITFVGEKEVYKTTSKGTDFFADPSGTSPIYG